jgi:GABA(A) receptor-associated protein
MTVKVISSTYRTEFPFEKRRDEASRIKLKYTDRVPVIVERRQGCESVPSLDKSKFLVPSDLTMGQFIYVIRKRIKLSPDKAIFVFVNCVLPSASDLLSTIYDTHKDSDGFLYVTYSSENTFG